MSEYQYYEFVALDGPISDQGLRYAQNCSSRAEVTRTRWQNTYEYGDFRGSVDTLLKYYDAHFYLANWGTVHLALAFPKNTLPTQMLKKYVWCHGDMERTLSFKEKGDRCVIWWGRDSDEPGDWIDGEGCIDELKGIRDELISGDFRALFLGWLADFFVDQWLDSKNDDEPVPPIPAGLDRLTKAQKTLLKHFEVERDVLEVAVELSPGGTQPEPTPMSEVLERFSVSEMRLMLERVAEGGGAGVMAQLKRLTLPQVQAPTGPSMTCREFATRIVEARPMMEKKREEAAAQEQRKQAERRRKHLESVLERADVIWAEVSTLMERTASSAYDETTKQLAELRDAYAQAGDGEGWQQLITAFRNRYADRPAMLRRIKGL